MRKGRLTIVGSGILTPAHLTQQAIAVIRAAEIVHVLVPDPLGLSTLKQINTKIKNLADLYYRPSDPSNGANRLESYERMVECILGDLRDGLNVCAVFYGHPGVFVYPSHACIAQARREGFDATMLPAVSAEDCLFADLGIDPGDFGCVALEASQFLFYQHPIDVSSALILWQVGVVGDETLTRLQPADNGLAMLQEKLLRYYLPEQTITLYEASTLPIEPPRIEVRSIAELTSCQVKTITTLFIAPSHSPTLDREFCQKWRIDTRLLPQGEVANDA